jgi:hypothetical protein
MVYISGNNTKPIVKVTENIYKTDGTLALHSYFITKKTEDAYERGYNDKENEEESLEKEEISKENAFKNLKDPLNFDINLNFLPDADSGEFILETLFKIKSIKYDFEKITSTETEEIFKTLTPYTFITGKLEEFFSNISILTNKKKSPILNLDEKGILQLARYTIESFQMAHFCIYNSVFGLVTENFKSSPYKDVNRITLLNIFDKLKSLEKEMELNKQKEKAKKIKNFCSKIYPLFKKSNDGNFNLFEGKNYYDQFETLIDKYNNSERNFKLDKSLMTMPLEQIVLEVENAKLKYQNRNDTINNIRGRMRKSSDLEIANYNDLVEHLDLFLSPTELTRHNNITKRVKHLEAKKFLTNDKKEISRIRKEINDLLIKSPIALKLKYVK